VGTSGVRDKKDGGRRMSTVRLDDNQGTARIDDNQGTARIDNNQGTARIDDSQGTAIIPNSDNTLQISGAGNASGIMSQPKIDMQGLASDQKRTGEVFVDGQIIDLNGKNYTIESIISMNSGEAVIYKIKSMDGKSYVLKHYKLDTPLTDAAKEVIKKIKDNPQEKIVKVYDFGRHNEQDFEIMEYAEGGTLDQYLKENGPQHEQKVLKDFVKQITEGLEQLHGVLNIIYQDLKPENIYFRDISKTSIILADFGISSLMRPGEDSVLVTASVTP
jgi:serine/threonine protein kinase